MMQRILYFVLLVALAHAATWMERLPMKPAHLAQKQGCYIKDLDDVIPFGESVLPVGACFRIDCTKRMIHYASCAVISTEDPKCVVTNYDLRRPYPDCCPDVRCDIDNAIL